MYYWICQKCGLKVWNCETCWCGLTRTENAKLVEQKHKEKEIERKKKKIYGTSWKN